MKTTEEISTTDGAVRHILANYEQTRSNDKALINGVLAFCRKNHLKEPSYETITRLRRKIQCQEKLFLACAEVTVVRS